MKQRVAISGNNTLGDRGIQNLTHFPELFQHTLCHPSHTLSHLLLHMADITRMRKQCVPGLPFGGEGGVPGNEATWRNAFIVVVSAKQVVFQLYLVNTVRTCLLVMEGQHLNSSVHVHVELPHEVR